MRKKLKLLMSLSLIGICVYAIQISRHENYTHDTKQVAQGHIGNVQTRLSPKQRDKENDIKHYREIEHPTPNFSADKVNTVEGVILHHTAEPTIERSLAVLTSLKKKVGTHCVIDTDGTRYIMCNPEVVTFHAGFSVLNGKVGCNNFTIGIEFQGNTLENPLTEDQINSAIEYLLPIMSKYSIPLGNVVSHKMVRDAYKKRFPHKKCSGKVDITDTEYNRFIKDLENALGKN